MAESGLFPSRPPCGYPNVRIDGHSIIQVHPENAAKIFRLFKLYGGHGETLDTLVGKLDDEGIHWLPSRYFAGSPAGE